MRGGSLQTFIRRLIFVSDFADRSKLLKAKNEACGFTVTQTSFKLTATPELLDWLCGIYPAQTGFSHKSDRLSLDNTERII